MDHVWHVNVTLEIATIWKNEWDIHKTSIKDETYTTRKENIRKWQHEKKLQQQETAD